jgi:hypothetical protein
MRTKTLLLSAAAVAAGVASLKAQSNVYSLNVVGYVNVSLAAGFNMIENPLDDGAGDIVTNTFDHMANGLGVSLPAGSTLYPWAGSTYGNPIEYFSSYGWYDSNLGGYATNKFAPGTGFFVNLPSATNFTFVGNVLQGTATNNLNAGFNMIGNPFPVAMPPGVAGDGQPGVTMQLPVSPGDTMYFYDNPGVGFYVYEFFSSYGWYDSGNPSMSTNGPVISVGQAVFLAKQSSNPWVESFTVTP